MKLTPFLFMDRNPSPTHDSQITNILPPAERLSDVESLAFWCLVANQIPVGPITEEGANPSLNEEVRLIAGRPLMPRLPLFFVLVQAVRFSTGISPDSLLIQNFNLLLRPTFGEMESSFLPLASAAISRFPLVGRFFPFVRVLQFNTRRFVEESDGLEPLWRPLAGPQGEAPVAAGLAVPQDIPLPAPLLGGALTLDQIARFPRTHTDDEIENAQYLCVGAAGVALLYCLYESGYIEGVPATAGFATSFVASDAFIQYQSLLALRRIVVPLISSGTYLITTWLSGRRPRHYELAARESESSDSDEDDFGLL